MAPVQHRPQMVDDGIVCSCGSTRCLAMVAGVWTPSRVITPQEAAEARDAFERHDIKVWMGEVLRSGEGRRGTFIAGPDDDDTLWWMFSPAWPDDA